MRSSVRSMVLSALMTALLAVFSQISVPVGAVSFTLQTFGAALTGYLLTRRAAVMTVLAYLLLGACGLPVFSAFSGGIGVLFGPTGGFLWGFLALAALCAADRKGRAGRAAAGLAGLAVVYIAGTAQLAWAAQISFSEAVWTGVAPFVVKDVISVAAAERLARTIERRIGCGKGGRLG